MVINLTVVEMHMAHLLMRLKIKLKSKKSFNQYYQEQENNLQRTNFLRQFSTNVRSKVPMLEASRRKVEIQTLQLFKGYSQITARRSLIQCHHNIKSWKI